MGESNFRGILAGAVFGIIGTIIGSISTGLVNNHIERTRQRETVFLESFKWDQSNGPVEYIQLKQMVDEMRSLSYLSSDSMKKMAAVFRKYPGCSSEISDRCKPAMVEIIGITRQEAGVSYVSPADIELLLSPKYDMAGQAVQRLQRSGWKP